MQGTAVLKLHIRERKFAPIVENLPQVSAQLIRKDACEHGTVQVRVPLPPTPPPEGYVVLMSSEMAVPLKMVQLLILNVPPAMKIPPPRAFEGPTHAALMMFEEVILTLPFET